VDRVTIREYGKSLEENVQDLVERIKRGRYRAKLIRRKYIPKANGKLRPLGIPATEDKLLQTAVSDILSAIFEQDFLPTSFGYRPGVGGVDAAKELSSRLYCESINYVVEADIKGYFNNIDHDWMLRMLEQRVDDKPFLRLINKWMKAGILEEDKSIVKPEVGTPQGGSISPILANVYLHYAFDLWFTKVVSKELIGRCYFVRYADDFVCLFQNKEDAEDFYKRLPGRLAKFGLQVAEEKTKIIHFNCHVMDNSFDFLGFEFRWRISRKGNPYISPQTSLKKMRAALKDLRQWCKENRHLGTRKIFERINAKLRGHYNYFGVPGNYKRISRYFYRTLVFLKKWLSRRSQKGRCSWKKFDRLLEIFKIAKPRIIRKRTNGQEQLALFSC
jgi:group II intron reverse transcriptase/maturase